RFHTPFVWNHLPTSAVKYKRAVIADECNAMVATVVSVADTLGLFPQQGKVAKVVDGCQRIRGFISTVGISVFSAGRIHRFRQWCIHSEECIVNQVNTPVGHQSARVIPEPTEVEMKAIRIEGSFWARAKKSM